MQSKFFILLLFSIVIISCGTKNKHTENSTNEDIATETAQSDAEPVNLFEHPDFAKKFNAYINFSNRFHKSATKSYEKYLAWVDKAKGPKYGKNTPQTLYELHERSLEKVAKEVDFDPQMKGIDQPMRQVVEKADALYQLINTANGYYEKEDYKDDDFAKGQVLHPQLMKAFEEYFAAYEKISLPFQQLQDETFRFDVEKFKANGQAIRYNLMINLKNVEDIATLIDSLDGSDLKKVDMKSLDEKMKAFKESHNKLENLQNDEAQLEKAFGNMAVFKRSNLDSYVTNGVDFIKNIRNLKERIKTNNFKYSIVHPSIPDKGSPAKLFELYSQMVNLYNRMSR
ncbi:DUF3829 domain-containing protein [Microscilla marina]|uniref:Lipoprotein, putative n=1 Tax=Microscilla marina ATCC 23134 TaxID=313606 RepID=A1ZL68_MICM2|nr:DUF3829 domain-containing protein [Microscilla marina]EAY29034.1 lipoprotein, putative [Microscilla marina ATCC 23134]